MVWPFANYLELGLRGLLIFRWILLSSYLLNFMAKEFFLITNATPRSLYEKSKTRATTSGFFAAGVVVYAVFRYYGENITSEEHQKAFV